MIFNDIYYFDEEKINSYYYQLADNSESSSTEIENSVNMTISSTFKSILLKLIGISIDVGTGAGVGRSKRKTVTRKTTMLDKLYSVLSEIGEDDERNFKDIYYLIEKYLQDRESILAVGKGAFTFLPLSNDKDGSVELTGVNFPVEINGDYCLLYNCRYENDSRYDMLLKQMYKDFGYEYFPLSDIILLHEDDGPAPVYSKRIFVIMESAKIVDLFGLHHTGNKMFYFLGRIMKEENNYFIIPYALWGECVIL